MRLWIRFILAVCILFTSCRTHRSTSTSTSSNTSKYQHYTQKIGTPINSEDNELLIKEIVSWLGTPYRDGACDKSGTDCSGFVKNVFKAVYNIELKRNSVEMYDNSKHLSKSSLKQGDLVFFKLNGKKISHVGIYIKNNKFAHASSSKGVMVSDLSEPYFLKGYFGGGRVISNAK